MGSRENRQLVEGTQKSWRKASTAHNQLPKIIQGVKFIDGLEIAAKFEAASSQIRRRLTRQAITKNWR